MENTLIRLNDVSFSYGTQLVLDRVSFELERNSFYAITGSNGSGKSTLVKLMLGLLKPTSGEIQYYKAQDSRIGYVAQRGLTQSIGFPASVEEIVGLPLNVSKKKYTKQEKRELIKQVLNKLEISDLRKRLISELSGGQLQRVLIARELVLNPTVLFLDEPTNALDKNMIKSLFKILKELQSKTSVTIVLITHSDEIIRDTIHEEYRVEDYKVFRVKGEQHV